MLKRDISPADRQRVREQFQRWQRLRPSLPKCGAKAKGTGEPCRQVAMANGRCAYHGGKTPSGKNWHNPVWPNGKAADAEDKLRRKLSDRERAAKRRVKRLVAMAPEERERYDAWQQSHRPGSPVERAARRQQRQQAAEVRKMLELDEPANPAADELQQMIDELKRQAKEIDITDEGIFG